MPINDERFQQGLPEGLERLEITEAEVKRMAEIQTAITEHMSVDGETPRVGRCSRSDELLISGPGHHDLF